MKGGVTSGIVYPAAVKEIAKHFHFCGISGTSAGAIAASVTAAAEYARRNGSKDSFEKLTDLSTDLSKKGQMLTLFRPDFETRKLHSILMRALNYKNICTLQKIPFFLDVLKLLIFRESGLEPVIKNGYGVCTGMANQNRAKNKNNLPLTEWLCNTIDDVAEKDDGIPLTFGDLWNVKSPPGYEKHLEGCRSINLQTVTSCLTSQRPFTLPFKYKVFAFDPDEWKRFFPKNVMDFLIKKSDEIGETGLRTDKTLPLPIGEDLPVIVAARMSLSFPILFTMIPLYRRNYEKKGGPLEKDWFSDGGITSNLPIHFFDCLYPRWPTLAINLCAKDENGQPLRKNVEGDVYLPPDNYSARQDLFYPYTENSTSTSKLLSFIVSIYKTSQSWHDNSFLVLPGFRDRVVEVWLDKKEGGLNLNMPPLVIENIIGKGKLAGDRISSRFALAPPEEKMSWAGHRWVRYRSAMAGLIEYLNEFLFNYDNVCPGDEKLDYFLKAVKNQPSYKFSRTQLDEARRATEELVGLLKSISGGQATDDKDYPFQEGPNPKVRVRTTAPMD